jgi:hypothetical protein
MTKTPAMLAVSPGAASNSQQNAVLPSYRVYLVRCWQEGATVIEGEPIWRFSLDAPWYQERRGFANLQALMDHLHTELMVPETGPSDE